MKKIYLAIPYSWNPDYSFKEANRIAAKLMNEGNLVFSPISHSHPIADYLPPELRKDSQFWLKYDLPMIDWADEVYVIDLGGNLVADSVGVSAEIRYAQKTNKPIKIIAP